ncbi:MAG: methyltransferase domain-containing protein [Rhizobiaceae bacterium]|nr:methyltransferase domain-containing protein [Rhizobiaceae bacterium]
MNALATVEKKLLNVVHDRAVFRRRVRVLSSLIADELGRDGTVLDLGCGDGSIARAIMDRKPGLRFRGIDVLVRETTLIPVTPFDGTTIPAPDGAYDWVTIVDVLHHTDDPARLVAEAARVARQGVVIKDHLREGLFARETLRLMDWVGNKGHGVRLPYNYLSRAEWDAIFEQAGIAVESWRGRLGLYPFPASLAFDRGLHFIARLR